MPFDISAGFSTAGAAVSKTAGQFLEDEHKSSLEDARIKLTHELALERQGKQQDFELAKQENQQTFLGGQGDLNRASEEKRTTDTVAGHVKGSQIAAGALIQGHVLAAEAQKEVARITAAGHKDYAEIMSGSREKVAKMNNDTKLQIQGASGLSPDAIENYAEVVANGGALPNLGWGASGNMAKTAIANRAAEIAQERGMSPQDFASGKVSYSSSQKGLDALTKLKTITTANVNAADKEAETVADFINSNKGLGPSGVPAIDRWLQAGKKNIAGDVEVAQLNAMIATLRDKQAQVMSGATGAAGITDSAREHVDQLLNGAMTKEQLLGVIKVLDMERINRLNGIVDSERDLIAKMTGKIKPQAPDVVASPTPGAPVTTPVTPAATMNNPTADPNKVPPKMIQIPLTKDRKIDKGAMNENQIYDGGIVNPSLAGKPFKWDPARGLIPLSPPTGSLVTTP